MDGWVDIWMYGWIDGEVFGDCFVCGVLGAWDVYVWTRCVSCRV